MPNFDSILQEKLDALEAGRPLEEVLASLPDEARDLKPLIVLAAAVRATPHPEPQSTSLDAQRSRIMAAAEVETRPLRRPATQPDQTQPRKPSPWTAPAAAAQPAYRPTLAGRPRTGRSLPSGPVLGLSVSLALLLCVGLIFLAGSLLGGRSAARLANVTGQVQVAARAGSQEWNNATTGQQVRGGQAVRTLGASSAILVFADGSRTYLGPNAEVDLTKVGGSDGSVQVEMTQKGGATRHDVIPFQAKDSYFRVRTPAGTASVHGTSFNVRVNQDGRAQVSVNRGEVRVQNADSEVTVLAGQATEAEPGLPPASPAYQFTVQGSLIAKQAGAWIVSGIQFRITESTSIAGRPQLGNTVQVTGRVLPDGSRLADSIEVAPNSDQTAFFTGLLERRDSGAWKIGGNTVSVNAQTIVEGTLTEGEPVRVTFNILSSGEWVALKIESLDEDPQQVTPTPSPSPAAGAMPSLSFEPDELETEQCTPQGDYRVSGSLRNTGNAGKDFAADVRLGYIILRGGEYIQSVDLNPTSWARIDSGETETYTLNIGMTDAFADAGEETEVKLRVFVAGESNRPDHHKGRATITIRSGCSEEPEDATRTPAPSQTATETGTEEPTPEETAQTTPTQVVTTTPTEPGQCTGAEPHPTGMTLAQRYGVPYEEIMYWFCQNYGFGEIDLAYTLSREANLPVTQIFEMRASGMGWGDIKKQVAPRLKDDDDKHRDDDDNDDKDKDKDKSKDKKDKKKDD